LCIGKELRDLVFRMNSGIGPSGGVKARQIREDIMNGFK